MIGLQAIAHLGATSLLPVAVAALEAPELPIQLAAIGVLHAIGDLPCVAHLLPLTKGFRTLGQVKDAARRAISGIQARHGTSDAGQLTLLAPTGTDGALSVAPTTGGLHLADGES